MRWQRFISLLVLLFAFSFSMLMTGCGEDSNRVPTTPTDNGNPPPTGGGGTPSPTPGGGTGGGGTPTPTPPTPPTPTPPTPPPSGGGSTVGGGPTVSTADSVMTETVASGLNVPWALVFATDGRLFFTEQPGRIRVMINGAVQSQPVYDKTSIVPGGESGMLGLALDPAFGSNRRMYVFYCFNAPERVRCRIERLVENNNSATFDRVLWEGDSGEHHPAGRLKFGPDGLLYVGYGDIFRKELAQDLSSDAGAILRMDTDGNPRGTGFASPYALVKGLRDPQGLAFDSGGNLYISEHGPDSNDEINLISPGRNYGWPTCIGVCDNPAWVDPIRLWRPETAAPSGATFYNSSVISQWNGSMLIALLGLSDNNYAHHLHRIKFDGPGGTRIVEEEVLFRDQFGRLRDVVQGPDGFVYFSTSNGGGSDRIIRVRPR